MRGSNLFSGKKPTQGWPVEDDERDLFARPYAEWAPPPYNNVDRHVGAAYRAMLAVGGMTGIAAGLITVNTECDRDLHHLNTRMLHGIPPMSLTRWRQKGLHEPANVKRACQHLSQVIDAFEYLNMDRNQKRMRDACTGIWEACYDFQVALNAYRAIRGRDSVSVTAMWEEYMVDYFQMVTANVHEWVLARVDELRETQFQRLRATPIGSYVTPEQMEILDRVHDLTEITNKADTIIMFPLLRYPLQELKEAAPRIQEDWSGYTGTKPMTSYPMDVHRRSKIYAARCKYLSFVEMTGHVVANIRNDRLADGDPERLEGDARVQIRAYKVARRELRGAPPDFGDEPWVTRIKNHMLVAEKPVQAWGFIAYRICYEHSDEEWGKFLERFQHNVTAWGEGIRGVEDVKPLCKVRWLDGRECGIPEGDIEAAQQHYAKYEKSAACDNFYVAEKYVFLAADKASIESYLNPVQDNAASIFPQGDIGSFILAVTAAEFRGNEQTPVGQRMSTRHAQAGWDSTLRVLGSVLFDDLWALLCYQIRFSDIARLGKVHPLQVYVGPSVPIERDGWLKSGSLALTVLRSFEKWRSI
ncbi:uncharacterized protein CTRU02_208313 [Colletotrichum truncatum]|uniref:Uncharacterized protein n=1 Tax=Colletotrichum truncatum TaxID=5467 RepID=A0ACC3YVY3_COLTU